MPGIRIRKAEITDGPRLADIAYRAWETGILPILTDKPGLPKGLKGKITDADTWNIVHFVRSLGGAGK